MKRLKIFGLLAAIVLLAFGLALSCDSSTPADEEPSSPAPVAHYSLDGGRLGLYFSKDPSRLPRATGTSAEDGDHYVLIEELSRRVLSAGLAIVGGVNGSAITLTPNQTDFPEQPPFTAEVSSDGGISVVGAPNGSGGTIDTPITGEREGSGAYQPGGNQGGQGGQGGNGGQPAAAKYTVTFNTDGGSAAPPPTTGIASGDTITLPPDPTKTDWVFGGWFLPDGTTPFTASTPVTANITVKAKWIPDPSLAMWEEIRVKNAELIALQVLGDEGADAALAALELLVDEAFKNSDVTKWISDAGDGIYSQVKGSGKTTLNYIDSELDATNTITFDNLPNQVTTDFDTTDLDGEAAVTATLTYAIGDPGSSNTDPTYDVVLQPIALFKVEFKDGATGKVEVGSKVITETAEYLTTTIGATTVKVDIGSDLMARSTGTPAGLSFDGDNASDAADAKTGISVTVASQIYTITISPLGYTVTFVLSSDGTGDFPVTSVDSKIRFPLSDPTIKVAPGGIVGAANMPPTPRLGGYTFVSWNLKPNGTGATFTDTTEITEDTPVYAKWTPISDTTTWGKFADRNNVIKLMPATTSAARTAAINELRNDVLVELRRMASTGINTTDNEIYKWFDLNADTFPTKAMGYIEDHPGTHNSRIEFGYVQSALKSQTAATIPMKTSGTGIKPADLVIEEYSLSTSLSNSYTDAVLTKISYPIGNGYGEAFIELRFYPVALIRFTSSVADTGLSGKSIKITDETHPAGETLALTVTEQAPKTSWWGTFDIGDSTFLTTTAAETAGNVKVNTINMGSVALAPDTGYVRDPTDANAVKYTFVGGVRSAVYIVDLALVP